MAKSKGINGVAIGMIAAGVLLVRAAIRGVSPLVELREIIGGKQPEPLSSSPGGTPITSGQGIAATFTPSGSPKNLRGLAPNVAVESAYIQNTWGIDVGGFATSGHVTNSDHYTGHALDAMTSDLQVGNAIVAHYKSHPDIKYIIWQHTIWSPDKGARYYGKSDHLNHVHLSFYSSIRGRTGR